MARVVIRNQRGRVCSKCGQVHDYLTDPRTHLPIALDDRDTRRLAILTRADTGGASRLIPKVGGQPLATVNWPPSGRIV